MGRQLRLSGNVAKAMRAIEWTPKVNRGMVTMMQSPADALKGNRHVDRHEFIAFGMENLPEDDQEFDETLQAYGPVIEAVKPEILKRWRVVTEIWNMLLEQQREAKALHADANLTHNPALTLIPNRRLNFPMQTPRKGTT